MFEKITEAEINERSMANVSTTPNRPTAFGESRMDAQALKLRFDRLSRYLAGRLNEIFAGLSDGNLAKSVKIVEEKGEETIEYSLAEFILKMIEGDLTQINVKVPEGTQRLDVICNQVLRWQNEIKTGDFADETVVVEGVTIRQFYEEFKKLEETGQGKPGEPGKSAYDYAVEGGYQGTEEEFAKKLATEYPSKVSQLENDEKYITASGAPVQTVNGKVGNVSLSAADVGARPDDWMPTAADVGARPDDWMPTASDVGARPATWMPSYSDVGAEKAGNVNTHNTNGAAHNDIRVLIQGLTDRINAVLDSDDTTLDELSEIVAYIKANKTLIESVTTNKVNVSDIIDNLETPDPTKPLSAAQGVVIFNYFDLLAQEFGAALDAKADKEQGVFFIKGEGTTAGTWLGGCSGIDSYYDGLMIAYKVGVAGASTTTLNINGLGAVKVVRNATTAVSTAYPVDSVVFLVYTVDSSGTAYWKAHDYDVNTYQRVYETSTDKEYAITTRYNTTDGSTYYAEYGRYTNGVTINPSTNTVTASKFKGALVGNADTATKATQDGNGKVIADTYATKTDIDDLKAELGIGGGYTNWIKKSVSTFGGSEIYGEDYNGDGKPDGYLKNTRMNSSGQISTASGMCLTGIIPVRDGDIVRIKNVTLEGTNTAYVGRYSSTGAAYASNITALGSPDADGVYTYVVGSDSSGTYAIRLSVGVVDETSILTINEEIVGDEDNGGSSDDKDTDNGVPSYIVEEAKRVANEVQNKRNAKSLVFPIMSDAHLYSGDTSGNHPKSLISAQYAGMGVKEMRKRIALDFVSYLGDYTWSSSNYTVEQVKKDITAFKETTDTTNTEIWCVGNHEVNYGVGRDRVLTADEIYSYVGANADGVKPFDDIHRCYGYLDFENQKIRVIYLNTCDTSDRPNTAGEAAPSEGVSVNQMRWIANEALNLSGKDEISKWGIIIVSHHPLSYLVETTRIVQILEAYKASKSGSVSWTVNNTSYSVDYNFTTSQEKAEIICSIHGHSHNFGSSKISSSSSITPWLWRICIPCLNVGRENEHATSSADWTKQFGEFDASGNPVYYRKETGTAKATSFCVINVDRINYYVYAHTFGAGPADGRSFYYGPSGYDISVTTSNCSGTNNPSTIMEGKSATLKFTANSGYKLPDTVTVTGASHTWDKASGTLVLSNPTGNVTVTITAVEAYTNVVPTAQVFTNGDNSPLKGVGYQDNAYQSSSGGASNGASGYTCTGAIPYKKKSDGNYPTIYVKGGTFDTTSNSRFYFYNGSKVIIDPSKYGGSGSSMTNINTYLTKEELGDKYWRFVPTTTLKTTTAFNANPIAYMAMSLKGSGANLIITLDEPIE